MCGQVKNVTRVPEEKIQLPRSSDVKRFWLNSVRCRRTSNDLRLADNNPSRRRRTPVWYRRHLRFNCRIRNSRSCLVRP